MGTVTAKQDYNKDWLRKLLRGEPHLYIGGRENPYLLRWYLIPRNHRFNFYLHKFARSDDDRALHTHPWSLFCSFILKGSYYEHTAGRTIDDPGMEYRPRWSLAHRKAEHAHRVELKPHPHPWEPMMDNPAYVMRPAQRIEEPAWTLFITTAKRREWGFLCRKKWMHWTEFTEGPQGETSKGCGEYA